MYMKGKKGGGVDDNHERQQFNLHADANSSGTSTSPQEWGIGFHPKQHATDKNNPGDPGVSGRQILRQDAMEGKIFYSYSHNQLRGLHTGCEQPR